MTDNEDVHGLEKRVDRCEWERDHLTTMYNELRRDVDKLNDTVREGKSVLWAMRLVLIGSAFVAVVASQGLLNGIMKILGIAK